MRFTDKQGNPIEMVEVSTTLEGGQERKVLIPKKQVEWGNRYSAVEERIARFDRIKDPVVAEVEKKEIDKEIDALRKEALEDETNAHPTAVALRSAQPLRTDPPTRDKIVVDYDFSKHGDTVLRETVRKCLGVDADMKHPTDEFTHEQLVEAAGTLMLSGIDVVGNLPEASSEVKLPEGVRESLEAIDSGGAAPPLVAPAKAKPE